MQQIIKKSFNKQRVVVVLGMHRSGTSAITRALELLGVGLGTDLHPAGFDNPTGFWEDRECLEINEELLLQSGNAYDKLGLAQDIFRSNPLTDPLKQKATQLVLRKLKENNGIWGFKDPRTCRLLPFWREVFDSVGCEVNYIIALRNPLSITSSLMARNEIPVEKGYFLWLQHIVPAIIESDGFSRVVVDYDLLIDSPLEQVSRISAALHLSMSKASSSIVSDFVDGFLDKDLRHTKYTLDDLERDRRVPSDVVSAFRLLLSVARDETSLGSTDLRIIFNELNQRLEAYAPAFSYTNALEDERTSLYLAVAERDTQIIRLNQSIVDGNDQIANLNEVLAAHERRSTDQLAAIASRLAQETSERAEAIASLNQTINERDTQIAAIASRLAQEMSERAEAIASLNQTINERDTQIIRLNQSIVDGNDQIANLNEVLAAHERRSSDQLAAIASRLAQEMSERAKAIASLNQTINERDSQIVNLAQVVAARDNQNNSLNQALAESDNQITGLSQALADARCELAQILASKSWRITKPLRCLRRNAVSKSYITTRRALSDNSRALWRSLPISHESKRSLKGMLFTTFPWVFRWSKAYQAWNAFNAPINYAPIIKEPDRRLIETETECEYVPLIKATPLVQKPAKLICFYLPQFHAIPENDEWWGEGFTEWDNVQPAQPQFEGHYQPHVPAELGYYNLLDPVVQRRQVELAKLYGIEGFCFYFYWFDGKRLLETPIENYLNDKTLDLPFCLCWANENWSRRWDGLDSEILIAQQHSVEDDLAFIQHVARYMRDPRYIRINGKPLLLVYRPSLLPSAMETASRWRDWCHANGIGEIYLAYTQSFETVDPARYGFDAAIEFPPNNSAPPNITGNVAPMGEDFGSTVYDWQVFVERSEHYKQQSYTLFRSVCPSWDNTARRKNRGTVFLNSTPTLYQRWLENAIRDTQAQRSNPDERLVFVNAWNEWAEGAHLEPDARYGYAWLQATRNALSGGTYIPDNRRKIVLVAHDAYPHGAQMLVVNLAKTLNQGMGFQVDLVCLGEGPLISEYVKWATVHLLAGKDHRGSEAKELANQLYQLGHRSALVNTTVSGYFLETLVGQGVECVALIHELRGVLDQYSLQGHAKAIATHASKVVFPAAEVNQSFKDVAPTPSGKVVVRPQGLYKRRDNAHSRESDHVRLRQKLGLQDDAQIVLGAGYADHRKGIDLFVAAGLAVAERLPKAYWVWIGHWERTMQLAVEKLLTQSPELKDRFIFPGLQTDTGLFYGGADVFALTSREDPFPSVVLEALDASVPVVGFEGAGGFISLLNAGCGKLTPKENVEAFALAVADLLEKPAEKAMLGQCGADLIKERFSFRHYVYDLLDLLGIGLARVSVIVPNYNYAHYLPERLESIIKQDYPIYEIIFLDDCSKDESIQIAEKMLSESGIDFRITINEENSGSVFRQWKKGVDLASGTYVWMAEADDSCSHGLVGELLNGFRTPGVVLSYCESQQINEEGNVLANNYLAYVSDIDARHWLTPFVVDGNNEIANSLSIKNTIPNVSAVLFEKNVLTNVLKTSLDPISSYRIAGDWLAYVLVLNEGRLAFSPNPLNKHRRHNSGMTISNINKSQLDEIRRMQKYVAKHHSASAKKVEQAKRYIESLQVEHGIAIH